MAEIWEYIANYNPQGFYEDNRAKMLNNDINTARLGAIQKQNRIEDLILSLKQRVAQGDNSALKELGVYSPETTKKYIENTDEMLNLARPLAQAVMKASPENREKVYKQMLSRLTSQNVDVSDMPQYYDEDTISFIANSDPQAIRDERLNEYQTERDSRLNEYQTERDYRLDKFYKENATIDFGRDLEKLKLQSELTDQRDEKNFNRDLQKLQYAYDRADAKEQRAAEFVMDNMKSGNISKDEGIKALGKVLGADIDSITPTDRLRDEFFNPETTQERRGEIASMLKDWTLATNVSKSGVRTPAQEAKDLYGAGYSPDSILEYQRTGNINTLQPRPIQGGSIAADVQKYNVYNQEKARLEEQLKRPLSEEEDTDLQSKIGMDTQAMKNAEYALKHGFKMEEIGAQSQNAINLENIKQQNRVGLAWLNDKISQGKEVRDLDNKKSFEEFKNTLPTEHALELMNMAKYMTEQGRPTTYEELAAREYGNALRAKQYENDYKQAQTKKIIEELPYVGKTTQQQNFEYLTANNIPQDVALDKAFGSKGTTVNIDNKGENAFETQMGKKYADKVIQNEEDIENLDNQLTILNEMERAISNDKVYQGTGGFVVNELKKALDSIGYETKGLDDAAVIATGSSMLMGRLRKDLMPGPLSDRDLQFLIRMTPGLGKTPEQNKAIINLYRKAFIRQAEYMRAYNDYVMENRTGRGFKEWARERGMDRAIFSKEEKQKAQGAIKTEGSVRYGGSIVSWRTAE